MVCDVFVKKTDGDYCYWQAKEKVMRVAAKYYDDFDSVHFLGRDVIVPASHSDYLTEKYGDWSLPVKEWNCARDEKTIVGDI